MKSDMAFSSRGLDEDINGVLWELQLAQKIRDNFTTTKFKDIKDRWDIII